MTDFKKELIRLVEKSIPELKDKLQAGAVDAETPVPYAAFTTPEEVPIRTIHGIAGYTVSFELSVYHNKISAVETLKHKLINALDTADLNGRKCYYRSATYGFYPDYFIHGYTLTLKII